jgi:hypothetical protein
MATKNHITHATRTSNLADVLERVLDKGVVIAGDIKIKLVDIELLTIQIRLVVCSVERAQAMGMNWWQSDPNLTLPRSPAPELRPPPSAAAECLPPPQPSALSALAVAEQRPTAPADQRIFELEQTVRRLERQLAAQPQ